MIVSSEIIEDALQIDERRRIIERHVSDDGGVRFITYLAEKGVDVEAMMITRQQILSVMEENLRLMHRHMQVLESAWKKRDAYLATLDDDHMKEILKVDDEEIGALRSEIEKGILEKKVVEDDV